MPAALYVGHLTHARRVHPRYRFRYRLFDLLIDVDHCAANLAPFRWLSHNRFNLFSFHDRDHGPRDGSDLGVWMRARLAEVGIDLNGGRILLLSMPRVFGYGFNPLSLWYCYHDDGGLRAVLCEVRNTFGEYHGYLLHDNGAVLPDRVQSETVKCFHVSPFFPVDGHYQFDLTQPAGQLRCHIRYLRSDGTQLLAAQTGRRRTLSDRQLLGLAWRQPLQSFKVMFAIHWHALRIWLRGGRFHRKPDQPPTEDVS